MSSLSSIRNRVDAIKTPNFDQNLDSSYFYKLNQLRLEYGINSTPYLESIYNLAYDLHSRAEEINNREIYYRAYQSGHVGERYRKVFVVSKECFFAISNLNKFLKNNDVNDSETSRKLEILVEQYFGELRIFVEHFSILRQEYQRYLSTLPKSAG